MRSVTSVYTELFDGLRGYYAEHARTRADAGFQAAASLSFICCVTGTAALTLGDYLINGNIQWSAALYEHKAALLLAGLLVGYAHVQFGKRTGLYNNREPSKSNRWKKYLAVYATVSAALLAGGVLVAFSSRP